MPDDTDTHREAVSDAQRDTAAAVDEAAAVLDDGGLVVYPTETVYGLGADALDATAVAQVFETKGRARSKPISMAVPDVETAAEYVHLSAKEEAFMREFLPGPVTVVVERGPAVPDVLTAGRDRVGIRIPDHETALQLAAASGPVTATSANLSGNPSAKRVAAVDEQVRDRAGAVVDGGETPGGGSTVVDVSSGTIHRRGTAVDAIDSWLSDS
jgi:L-threonylcarbamoyladenylate synthase